MPDDLIKQMENFSLFSALTQAERASVATIITSQPMNRGDKIFAQGDLGDAAYVVLDGKVNIMLGKRQISTMEQGAIIGEAALVCDLVRSAAAVAASDGMLWKIPRDGFLRLNREGCLGTYKVCARLAGTLVGRLSAMNQKLMEVLEANPPGREMDRLKTSLLKDWSF